MDEAEIGHEQNNGASLAEKVCRLLLLLLLLLLLILYCVVDKLCHLYCFYFRPLCRSRGTLLNNNKTIFCCLAWNITNSVPTTYASNF